MGIRMEENHVAAMDMRMKGVTAMHPMAIVMAVNHAMAIIKYVFSCLMIIISYMYPCSIPISARLYLNVCFMYKRTSNCVYLWKYQQQPQIACKKIFVNIIESNNYLLFHTAKATVCVTTLSIWVSHVKVEYKSCRMSRFWWIKFWGGGNCIIYSALQIKVIYI